MWRRCPDAPRAADATVSMASAQVQIHVSDEITPDCLAGLRVYAELTQGSCPPSLIERWLYWYRDNPFGPGLFALAKDGQRVVGVYTLIPIEMWLDGRVVRGAKGEAFGVVPEFRTAVDGQTGVPLPLALIGRLNRAAWDRRVECIVAVSNRAASACHRLCGARLIECPAYAYYTFFQPPRLPGPENRLWRLGRSYAAWAASSALRLAGRCRPARLAAQQFQLVSRIQSTPEDNGHDMLLRPSSRMFDFRFPPERHLIYRMVGDGAEPAYLVFTRPEKGAEVGLRHWSRLTVAPESLAEVLRDVLARCRAAGAASLRMVFPETEASGLPPLGALGFLRRKEPRDFYLYISADSDQHQKRTWQWRLTNAHVGFF